MNIQPLNDTASSGPAGTNKSVTPVPDRPAVAPPSELANAVKEPTEIPSISQLTQALKNINKTMQEQAHDLEFSVDPDSDQMVIRVVDQKTKEILRQIPSEEVLQIAKALDNLQQGLLIRQKA